MLDIDEVNMLDKIRKIGCTCPNTCDYDCKGECGCEVCEDAWADFLSAE